MRSYFYLHLIHFLQVIGATLSGAHSMDIEQIAQTGKFDLLIIDDAVQVTDF